MIKYLKNKGYKNIISNNMFILAEGELPICLCAHLDTVFPRPPYEFYFDQEQKVLWSPQGLGADDRAGIYAIINLLEKGYRPSIIFTDLEEKGGIGAETLIKTYPECPIPDCKALIQLDRQGKEDAVYYDCDNEDFENLIGSYNFKINWGTFSDISIIAPQWKIAAVNLSVGYYNEHHYTEILNMRELHLTILRLEKMLKDCKNWLAYAYIPYDYSKDKGLFNNSYCVICNKPIPNDDPLSQLGICNECYQQYNLD